MFHKYQHGFTKYNGTERATVEVGNTILNNHKFIAVLDLMKAYDRVSRSLLSTVCQERLQTEHLQMTELLLQPLSVRTSKDITNSCATITIGVPQGESFSCTYFNIFQDTLLEKLSRVPHHNMYKRLPDVLMRDAIKHGVEVATSKTIQSRTIQSDNA